MGQETRGKVRDGSGTLGEVRDMSGALGEVCYGSGDPQGGPVRVGRPSVWSGTG